MRLLLLVVLKLLPILAQDFAVSSKGYTYNATIVANVSGTDPTRVVNVVANFTRDGATAFQWVGVAWIRPDWGTTNRVMDCSGGIDVFYCNPDRTVGRAWVTSVTGIPGSTAKGRAEGSCTDMNIGGQQQLIMNFSRPAECNVTTCRNHSAGQFNLMSICGTSNAVEPTAHDTRDPIFIDLGLTAPTPPPPSPPPSPKPAEVIPGYPQGIELTNGAVNVKVGWELLANSVRFAAEAPRCQWVSIGLQDPSTETKMTGEAFVGKAGETEVVAHATVRTVIPTPLSGNASSHVTASNVSNANNVMRIEFERTLAGTGAGSIGIADPTNVRLMVAAALNTWPATHTFRQEVKVNLQSGGSTAPPELPYTRAKIAGIVIIGTCCFFGLMFTVAFDHTCLGRFCFFKRICKDNQFIGPRTPACFDLTWGQAILVLTYFGAVTLFSRLEFGQQTELRFLRAMGWTSTVCIACASIPVARQSMLLYFFGMSFERAVLMHRIAARFAILIVLMHFVAVLLEPSYIPFNLEVDPIGEYKVVLKYGFWTFMMMLLMFCTSLPFIRRRYFEVFYYIHHVFIVVWILAILHNSSKLHQGILLVPLGLWVLDRLLRCYRGRIRRHELVKSTIMGDALRLEFKGKITSCFPPISTESGSYAFLNVPGVSWLQWHPFSISSRASAENYTFHIKNMGVGTFTGRLHEYFAKNPNGKVNVDGPYGHCAVRFEEYSSLILFAGGIGITPMIAILDDLYEKCKAGKKPPRLESVVFVWTVQTKDSIKWMEDVLTKIQAAPEPVTGVKFDIQVFVTRSKEESVLFKSGRPKLDAVFDSAERPKDGAGKDWNIGVLVCGPEPMVNEVQKMSQNREVDFHKEIFAF